MKYLIAISLYIISCVSAVCRAHTNAYPDTTTTISRAEQRRLGNIDTIKAAEFIHIDSIVQGDIVAPTFIPSSKKATWLALIPGGGQIYNRKYWKLPIIYGGFLGCTYAFAWNNQYYRDYSQAYLDIMDNDPNTNSYLDFLPNNYPISGREEWLKTVFKNKKNVFRRQRDLSIFAFIGVYALSIIDAYVDAELSNFDITPDITMKLSPTNINIDRHIAGRSSNNWGLSCNITF